MINAVGTIFFSLNTKRICLGLRTNEGTYPLTWSFWGGKVEDNETFGNALARELQEELGVLPDIVKTFPLDSFTSNDHKFKYASYVSLVADEFSPALNEENVGYCWVDIGSWPKPLHPGTKIILNNKNNINKLKTILKRLPSDILVVYINKKAGNPASLLNI